MGCQCIRSHASNSFCWTTEQGIQFSAALVSLSALHEPPLDIHANSLALIHEVSSTLGWIELLYFGFVKFFTVTAGNRYPTTRESSDDEMSVECQVP